MEDLEKAGESNFSVFPFSSYADKSLQLLLDAVYMPLVISHLLMAYDENVALIYLAGSLVVSLISINFKKASIFLVTIQSSIALYFYKYHSPQDENLWLMNLFVIYLVNYFSLPKISSRFGVPKVVLSTISLVFLNIFLINSFS